MSKNIFKKFRICWTAFWIFGIVSNVFGPESILVKHALAASNPTHKIIAFYFHGDKRCPTCKKLEQLSREAIEEGFQKELQSGILVFRSVNVDMAENRHYAKDFGLYTMSLVIVEMNGDKIVRHMNLIRIWELVRDPESFHAYVREETGAYLKGLASKKGTE